MTSIIEDLMNSFYIGFGFFISFAFWFVCSNYLINSITTFEAFISIVGILFGCLWFGLFLKSEIRRSSK